jgi:hypothetical protein
MNGAEKDRIRQWSPKMRRRNFLAVVAPTRLPASGLCDVAQESDESEGRRMHHVVQQCGALIGDKCSGVCYLNNPPVGGIGSVW